MRRASILTHTGFAVLFFGAFATVAAATETDDKLLDPSVDQADEAATSEAAPDRKRINAREAELETIRRSIEVSARRQAALQDEIDALQADTTQLRSELVDTADRVRFVERNINQTEVRLERLYANEDGIRRSLLARRDVIAEILIALQRMGRTPPPALLSRPEDAIAAIRGSILAGAVLPDVRVEAEALASDLAELTDLRARIEAERDELRGQYASLGEEQVRIDLLIDTKRSQEDQTLVTLEEEQLKAAELASRAVSLEDLIESMESELEAAARAAAEAEAAKTTATASPDEAVRRLADNSRLAPAVRFVDAKGLLPLPVSGELVLNYGKDDGLGGETQGISLTANPGARIVSPSDGWVVYAGPFRTYGLVLILNVGDDYHIILAGMERIDASVGQFVLAGEPVAVMGSRQIASVAALDQTSTLPILYIEFRKDGRSIDPAPWWGGGQRKEARG